MSVVSRIKAVPASSLITWLVISPGPCQIRNYPNPIILMHMHDAGAGWMGLFAPQHLLTHSLTYLKCTCWLQQGFRGLPVLDYTQLDQAQSYLKKLISQAQITWSGICPAVLLSSGIVTWNVETPSKCSCFYGLVCFTVDWFTGLHFTVHLKLDLVCMILSLW